MSAKHRLNSWVPRFMSKVMGYKIDAVTLGRTIHWRAEKVRVLVPHELEHVRQYEREGLMMYPRYVWEFVCGLLDGKSAHQAYREISYEVEARAANPYEK